MATYEIGIRMKNGEIRYEPFSTEKEPFSIEAVLKDERFTRHCLNEITTIELLCDGSIRDLIHEANSLFAQIHELGHIGMNLTDLTESSIGQEDLDQADFLLDVVKEKTAKIAQCLDALRSWEYEKRMKGKITSLASADDRA